MEEAMMYKAKLVIEKWEEGTPVRRASTARPRVYDEVRIEVAAPNADVALDKLIRMAQAMQADRDARALMPGDQNTVRHVEGSHIILSEEMDEEDED